MVVDKVVEGAIRAHSQAHVAIFVASCAERMVQILTGLSGEGAARRGDVEIAIRLVEDLWSPAVPSAVFLDYTRSLEEFHELQPSDEEIVDVVGIYSFYSVLVLRYAAMYRYGGDVEDAVQCAHVSLTAMGQLDHSLDGAEYFAQEAELQQHSVSLGNRDAKLVRRLRGNDQAVSQDRLLAIRGRLA